jgi:DNA helicase-2/ATP-dependent DNA helicase PcrA
MSDYNSIFTQTLQSLNSEQKEAVNTIDGPVLVVAGPGTGKTHILSARIGQILTQTDTAPYNVLCLTFTDAGVQAMRERLLEIIGPIAHKIHIFTFHSFCNKIIQDNLDLFARQDLALLDDLERQEIIRTLLDELPYDHALKRGMSDVYFYEKHLADLFKMMKTEAWAVDFVEKQIDSYLSDLPQRPEFIYQITKKGLYQKGDIKQDKLDEVFLKMERLRAAVQLYPKFEKILRGMRRYDFDDMVLWVIDAFERLPFLLRNYQEQYLYFLVDEYQDTNGSQNKILSQLIGFWENPNIFIVGDDDQAIYEFQGARLKSLLDFYEAYKKQLKIILLKENYRSTQAVLDQAKQLIDSNNLRIINQLHDLSIDKSLIAKGVIAQSDVVPNIVEYANRFQEIVGIVQDIEKLQTAGYPLSKIAIIYARHREAENIIGLLDKKGIPYQTKRRINILDTPLIQNFRLLLGYIALEAENPYSGEHLLFKVLNINFLEIQAKDILLLAKYISDKTATLTEEDLSLEIIEKNTQTWRDTLNNLPKIGFKKGAQLKQFSTFLNQIIQDTHNLPLLNWVEKIINQSGLMAWVQAQPNKIVLLQTINTFFEYVKSETERKPRLTLNQLLTILNILDKNNLAIELVQNVQNREGVVLTTAHSAKGLEFERVYLIDAVESEWENAKSGNRNRFALPDTLTFTTEEDATEARRRLFYVAMTRAKEYLQISYAKADEKGKALSQSQFVDELSSSRQQADLEDTLLLDNQFSQLGETVKINTELIENEYVKDVLKDFKLSVSALNIYLECPLSFYFEYILKIPSTMSEAARYGSAMHYALRKLFGEMLRAKDKQFPNKTEFIQFFEVDMHLQKSRFSANAFDRRLTIGRENLGKIYDQNVEKWAKNVVVERSIAAECAGVPIKGVIDKIEFKDDGTVHIVDYKTGKMQTEQVSKFSTKKPLGGQYWRQLVFYKLLYENYRANLVRVKSGEINYLEPDVKGVFKQKVLEIEPKDADILRGVIVETWGKIQDNQFEGCGKKDCAWCNFIRNNQTTDSFRNTMIEDLDE